MTSPSPKRKVHIKSPDKREHSIHIPLPEIEETSRQEFDLSKFISENPYLSFAKDSSESITSPTPVTVIERGLFGEPQHVFSETTTVANLLTRMSESMASEVSQGTDPTSPVRKVKSSRESSLHGDSEEQSTSSDLTTHFQPDRDVLDYSAKLFLLRHQSPPIQKKRPKKKQPKKKKPFYTVIDPYVVGLITMQKVLREHTILKEELKRDESSMECIQTLSHKKYDRCPCDVPYHPKHWTLDVIQGVHDYSFLLDCKDLVIEKKHVFALNQKRTVVFFNVPMVDGHPWKKKAEQVLRYIDVELGVGDQTPFDWLYYRQPCDRKIFLIIASHKVIGIVVAEKQLTAHRVLTETMHYRDLEVTPVPVRVGINRLWVHVSMRRHHLASLLCDFVGRLFYKGERLKKKDFAFNSNFSNGGVAFARIFLKPDFVSLYKGKSGIKL